MEDPESHCHSHSRSSGIDLAPEIRSGLGGMKMWAAPLRFSSMAGIMRRPTQNVVPFAATDRVDSLRERIVEETA